MPGGLPGPARRHAPGARPARRGAPRGRAPSWRPSMVPQVRWERRGGHLRKHTATWIHKGGVARPRSTRADLPLPPTAYAARRASVRARTRAMKARGRSGPRAGGLSAFASDLGARLKAAGGLGPRPKTARGRWKRARKILVVKKRAPRKGRALKPSALGLDPRGRRPKAAKAERGAAIDPGFGRPFIPHAAQGAPRQGRVSARVPKDPVRDRPYVGAAANAPVKPASAVVTGPRAGAPERGAWGASGGSAVHPQGPAWGPSEGPRGGGASRRRGRPCPASRGPSVRPQGLRAPGAFGAGPRRGVGQAQRRVESGPRPARIGS